MPSERIQRQIDAEDDWQVVRQLKICVADSVRDDRVRISQASQLLGCERVFLAQQDEFPEEARVRMGRKDPVNELIGTHVLVIDCPGWWPQRM